MSMKRSAITLHIKSSFFQWLTMASYASSPAYKKFAKERTHAAVSRRLSSTSSSSKVEDASNQNIQVLWQSSRWNLEKCEKTYSYHLGDLTQSSAQATLGESDHVCCMYLERVFPPPTYKCVKRQVQAFTLLPELFLHSWSYTRCMCVPHSEW